MNFNGIPIIESLFMEPDFFAISDWRRTKETAQPVWLCALFFDGKLFAHPNLVKEMLKSPKQPNHHNQRCFA